MTDWGETIINCIITGRTESTTTQAGGLQGVGDMRLSCTQVSPGEWDTASGARAVVTSVPVSYTGTGVEVRKWFMISDGRSSKYSGM